MRKAKLLAGWYKITHASGNWYIIELTPHTAEQLRALVGGVNSGIVSLTYLGND